MFARIIKARSKEYVIIVRGYRDQDGKVKHKTVANLGVVNDKNREELLAFGKKLAAIHSGHDIISDADDITETARHNWAISDILENLWQKFRLDDLIQDNKTKLAIELMLACRLIEPSSKLNNFNNRNNFVGFEDVNLHHLYRSLDTLADLEEDLQQHIFSIQKNYGGMDVVFFDVTTMYFESQKSDELRKFGYSKDCKFNETQIVLSLVVNKEGRPLAYEIFPGNTAEGKTLLPCLLKLKEKFNINKVIIVSDRGIGSQDNLKDIKAAGFDYIAGISYRRMSNDIKEEVILNDDYKPLYNNHEIMYKKTVHKGINFLCLWSLSRAKKDAKDRERLVAKAINIIEKGDSSESRGAKKYLVKSGKESKLLDQDKIENDARFDGYYVLGYSDQTLEPQLVASSYHTLWKIEESFRTMKSFFQARPMFHWTETRITGHIMLNFIALMMQIDLELALKGRAIDLSHQDTRDALKTMERSILQVGMSKYYSYAALTETQKSILSLLKINIPKNQKIN